MGSCLGKQHSTETTQILEYRQCHEDSLERHQEEERRNKKILLVGSSGSGKSTILKQLCQIYGQSPTKEQLAGSVQRVHEQCINQMKHALDWQCELRDLDDDEILEIYRKYVMHEHRVMALVFGYTREFEWQWMRDALAITIPEEICFKLARWIGNFVDCSRSFATQQRSLSPVGQKYANYIQSLHHTQNAFNDEIVGALKALWAEDCIQAMYRIRDFTYIEESTGYFLNKLDALHSADYVPNFSDFLRERIRTRGAVDEQLMIRGLSCHFYDVGGLRSERKKWIHCFEAVDMVISVVSLSCYDEVLWEDENVNSMEDQLNLFANIINNKWFSRTKMILFLNKKDLFAEKIKRVPLTICESFKSYTGDPYSFDETTAYIRDAFMALDNCPHNEPRISTHITCAIDTAHPLSWYEALIL